LMRFNFINGMITTCPRCAGISSFQPNHRWQPCLRSRRFSNSYSCSCPYSPSLLQPTARDNPLESGSSRSDYIAVNQFQFVRGFVIRSLFVWTLLAGNCLPAQTNFQFAFLSDTHVGSLTAEEDLRATIRDLNEMTNLSFAVLAGDVTEYGSREQLLLAKQLLGEIKIPVHVVPGNHDTKWSESGATDFPRIFGDERFNFEFGGFRFIGLHQGPLMKMGDGFWSPQDVRWLRETLQKLPDQKPPLVFVTHYPLDDGIANWFEVLDLLKQYNTQVVLHGHGHANRAFTFEGVPGVMGRSNLRARDEVGGFNIVSVRDGKMIFSTHRSGRRTLQPWTDVNLLTRNYSQETNRYPRPDFSVNQRFPKVKARWELNTGFTISSTPAIWKDTVIIGDASGTVHGIGLKSGQVKWTFKCQNAVYSTPEVSEGRAVFASADGNIHALDATTGREAWRFETPRPVVACPRIADGVVYLGSSEGKFRALSLATGKLLWEFTGVKGFVETKPLLHQGKVIFGAWDGHLYALNAKTGALLWKWQGDREGALLSPAACWPVAVNGRVFIVAPDRKMTAIDAQTGEQIWRTADYQVRESIGLSEDGQRIYVRAMNNFIYAFSTSARTPEKIWELNAGFGYDINSAMLVEKAGTVFYGTKNGLILALNGRTGAMKWQHKIGTGVVNTVVPLSGQEILATDFAGKIVRLAAE
jgi:outer membrane protein assembly factor BamB/predicted phosphodiesterase